MGAGYANAQITTGEPSASKVRIGNRPEAGDFGLFAGVNLMFYNELLTGGAPALEILPIVNMKYYMTDQFEARLGLEVFKSKEKIAGDRFETGIPDDGNTIYGKNIDSNSAALLYPGVAYHFARTNLLDVYAGVELPFGWTSDRVYAEDMATETISNVTKSAFQIGVGAFIGIQAFIANLPLAIGLEYGISSRFDSGLKYKYQTSTAGTETIHYSPDLTDFPSLSTEVDDSYVYEKLQAKKGAIGNEIRFTLSYYFK